MTCPLLYLFNSVRPYFKALQAIIFILWYQYTVWILSGLYRLILRRFGFVCFSVVIYFTDLSAWLNLSAYKIFYDFLDT